MAEAAGNPGDQQEMRKIPASDHLSWRFVKTTDGWEVASCAELTRFTNGLNIVIVGKTYYQMIAEGTEIFLVEKPDLAEEIQQYEELFSSKLFFNDVAAPPA